MIASSDLSSLPDILIDMQIPAYSAMLDVMIALRDTSNGDHRKFYASLLTIFDDAETDATKQMMLVGMLHLYTRIRFGAAVDAPCLDITDAMVNTIAGFIKALQMEKLNRERKKSEATTQDRPGEHRRSPGRSLH